MINFSGSVAVHCPVLAPEPVIMAEQHPVDPIPVRRLHLPEPAPPIARRAGPHGRSPTNPARPVRGRAAGVPARFGDSVTIDHIGSAGRIPVDSPAARYRTSCRAPLDQRFGPAAAHDPAAP
ncbi:hypothetical protein GCM10009608_58840 [Pseudonocardia alaniniphila]